MIEDFSTQRAAIDRLTDQIAAQIQNQVAGQAELKHLAHQTLQAIDGHLDVARVQADSVAQQSNTVALLVQANQSWHSQHSEQMASIITVVDRQQTAIDRLLESGGRS